MTNIVELKNLTVNYKPNKEVDKELIHGIDINFRKGHITGVVGESGSGKSILMRSIMSILPNNIFDKNDKFFFDGMVELMMELLMELRVGRNYQSL